ncbi:hypothetical protein EC900091_5255, partial [Escherichia coli 90.0091]
TTFNC